MPTDRKLGHTHVKLITTWPGKVSLAQFNRPGRLI